MTISSSVPPVTAGNAGNTPEVPTAVGVALLKKAQDQMKQEGTALVKMLEQSAPSSSGYQPLDTYA